ncbi:LytR/AlgR family response regulator transcription factor [Fibrella forsythiae]|uniref:Response regulator n=1 Tax=Fibrella forsythiae TaxID=2817061 RepID=A0ABS3JFY2_9BACT|nr:response regulator [Fibrella forsythiae]MBO0948194.1 response regulator [Fibrella forsythiae]
MVEKLTLFIVEDEVLIAENLKFTLEDLGFAVNGMACNVEQAADFLTNHRPDLVLLDINLGTKSTVNNGLALAQRLSQDQIPFIFLTAYADRDTIMQATQLRPSGYLIKPVNASTLFAAIQTAIQNQAPASKAGADKLPGMEEPDYFFVKVGKRNLKLYWQDVYCLEATKNYVQIHVVGTPVTYTVRGTLQSVMQQVIPMALQPAFQQFNRSTAVNVQHITRYDSEAIYCQHVRISNTRLSPKELQVMMAGIRPQAPPAS